jgi:hypothetical protein
LIVNVFLVLHLMKLRCAHALLYLFHLWHCLSCHVTVVALQALVFLEDASELCVRVFGQGVEWGGVLVRTGQAYMALHRWKEACKVSEQS